MRRFGLGFCVNFVQKWEILSPHSIPSSSKSSSDLNNLFKKFKLIRKNVEKTSFICMHWKKYHWALQKDILKHIRLTLYIKLYSESHNKSSESYLQEWPGGLSYKTFFYATSCRRPIHLVFLLLSVTYTLVWCFQVFRGRIFSHVQPFYERAVSDLDPKWSMHRPV